jgi:hypothetical protein
MELKYIDPDVIYTMKDAGNLKGYSAGRMRQFVDSGAIEGRRLSSGERVIPGRALLTFPEKRTA